MSVAAGFTAAEIVEFVYEYERQPHGLKSSWLVDQGITSHRLKRWRRAVYDGDLERQLIPREGEAMISPTERTALAKKRQADQREAEFERLQAQVRELKQVNEALGKAIGLLHARSEHEPDAIPTSSDPSSSSRPKTAS